MKSDETIQRLSKNPFYTMNEAEVERLEQLEKEEPKVSSKSVESKKKEATVTLGNATVKETGKLAKHASDPVME